MRLLGLASVMVVLGCVEFKPASDRGGASDAATDILVDDRGMVDAVVDVADVVDVAVDRPTDVTDGGVDASDAADGAVVDASDASDAGDRVDVLDVADVPVDQGIRDAGPDAPDLGTPDTGNDTGPVDTGNDTGPIDTGIDVPRDTGNDTGPVDTGNDIGFDVGFDTGNDTGPDVRDTGPVDTGQCLITLGLWQSCTSTQNCCQPPITFPVTLGGYCGCMRGSNCEQCN